MADDVDVIYVDLAPRLDENATERETGKLRDKMKSGAKGIGKGIGEALHSELAQELGRELEPLVHDWAMGAAKDIGASLGTGIKDFAKDFGVDIDGMTDKVHDFADSLGIDEKTIGKFSDAFKDFKNGSISKGVDDLSEALGGKLPDSLQDVVNKSSGLMTTYQGLKGDVKDVTTAFGGLVSGAPAIEAAIAEIAGAAELAAGPLAAFAAVLGVIDYGWQNGLHSGAQLGEGPEFANQNLPHWYPKSLPKSTLPPTPGLPPPGTSWQMGPDGKWVAQPMIGSPGAVSTPGAAPPNFYKDWYQPGDAGPALPPGLPSDVQQFFQQHPDYIPDVKSLPGGALPAHTNSFTAGGGMHATLADFTHPSTPPISGPEDLPGAAAGVTNLYRFAESLVGTPYSQPLRNDCSGMVSELAAVAVSLPPPNAGQRFTTTNEGQRLAALGFRSGMGGPNDLSVGWYDHGGGNFGHTAATLPGGLNAESGGSHGSFLLGPGAAGASSPQFDHHMYLPMGPESYLGAPTTRATLTGYGSGVPAAPAPGVPGIPFAPGLGAVPPSPTQGNTYNPVSQPGLGHGSGVGVGGGVIGLAEQAGAMAAGAMSFGGGTIAAQIAEQEMNLAIQKGGQMAAVAAKAPFETFGLHGGQMGAPSTGSGGWISQILGGMIGQQFNAPNIAGATQAPKEPQGHDAHEQGDAAGKSTQGGPAGTKEDPHYTKIVGGGTQPPQGAMTSAMTTHGIVSAMV